MGAIYYPKARLTIDRPGGCGAMNKDGSKKVVWHTTETSGGFYTKRAYYHIQLWENSSGVAMWRQFIPFDRASCALRNDSGTVTQTNRDGDVNINVAIVGYARNTPYLSNAMLDAIAEFMVWAEEEWGIPAEFPYAFQGGEAYGVNGAGRLTLSQWDTASGHLGHQDVPDGNTHWDPGRFPVEAILAKVEKLKGDDMAFTPEQEAFLAAFADEALKAEAKPTSFVHVLNFYRGVVTRLNVAGFLPDEAAERLLSVAGALPVEEQVTIVRG